MPTSLSPNCGAYHDDRAWDGVLARPHGTAETLVHMAMVATYFAFVADCLARLYLADPRLRWFLRHLFDLAIIVLPFLRRLRLLSVIDVLQRAVGDNIRGRVMIYTAAGVLVMVYASSSRSGHAYGEAVSRDRAAKTEGWPNGQAGRGVGHRVRRQDGDSRNRQTPRVRTRRRRREQSREGGTRRRRDLRTRPLVGTDRHRRRRCPHCVEARRVGALLPDGRPRR